jgi:mono/diheme cytochrome c family protein
MKTWIRGGSTTGLPYGDPAREGGQHISKGGMPAFGGQLSDAEIENVILYVRTTFAK